jgi:MYXO-CTERM domain-containing protein
VSRIAGFLVLAFAMFALAGEAHACVCVSEPLEDRLDQADAAIVGRVVSEAFPDPTESGPSRLLGVDVEQRVKGEVPDETAGDDKRRIFVRTPYQTDCDVSIARTESVGLLLTRAPDGAWLANACSVVAAGALVAAGGEPRGGVIKVVIGLALLGIVLSWALRRRRLGIRPDLPGPPEP